MLITAGFLGSILVVLSLGIYGLFHIDRWLIVDEQPVHADMIVVLGGGASGRLRKGINLYEQGYAQQLLLIDERESDWTYIIDNLCQDCVLKDKKVDMIIGSTSTITDASLVKDYCLAHGINSFLVVSDPYHTRRVLLTFYKEFKPTTVKFNVISSEDQSFLPPAGKAWWTNRSTLENVWIEAIKCFYMLASFVGLTV